MENQPLHSNPNPGEPVNPTDMQVLGGFPVAESSSAKDLSDKPTGDFSYIGQYDAGFKRSSGEADAEGKPIVGGFKGGHTYRVDESGKKLHTSRATYKAEFLSNNTDAAEPATEPDTTEPEPVKMSDESFTDFIENTDDEENKEGVQTRYQLVKKWGLEHLLEDLSDTDAYKKLADDSEWNEIRETAEWLGVYEIPDIKLIPDTEVPDIKLISDNEVPDIKLLPETDEARRTRLGEIVQSKMSDSKALTDQLDILRDNYVKWSTKRSGQSAGDKAQLERVTGDYSRARDAVSNKLIKFLKEANASEEDILHFAKIASAGEVFKTTFLIKDTQETQADNKRLKGAYDWWGRQQTGGEGFIGRIKESFSKGNRIKTAKKIVAMGVVTFIPALGIGAAAAVVAGSLISGGGILGGGVAGGLIGKGITKSQFSRKASQEAGALTNAQIQEAARIKHANDVIQEATSLDGLKFSKITEGFNDVTEDRVKGNRKRLVGSIAVGAVSGLAGGLIGGAITNHFTGGPNTSVSVRPGSSPEDLNLQDAADGAPEPQVPVVPRPPQAVVDLRPQTTTPPVEVVDLRPEVTAPTPAHIELPADFEANMPYTNAADVFNSPNPSALIQSTLDEYNARTGQNFVWESGGNRGFRLDGETGRYINPAELAEYNRIMAEIMNRSLETLPEAA